MTREHVAAPALKAAALEQAQPRGELDAAARLAVAGLWLSRPDWDGIVCLPGDPSHWVHLSAGEIVSFQSFLTLRLARALGADGASADMAALSETMARPERLATQLRSAELNGNSDEMLGHLLGAELAAARPYWLGQQVVVLDGGPLGDVYEAALAAQGVPHDDGARPASRGECVRAARAALAASKP